MSALRVTTWNVLHRVHGLNWKEPAVARFSDERVRCAHIVERVRGWLEDAPVAVCLQEVSGDLRGALARALPDTVATFVHTYPRVPSLRVPGAHGLSDPREHLLTFVAGPETRALDAATFSDDFGKGYLAVEVDGGTRLVTTHVTFGARGRGQLAQLATHARAAARAVIVGDFNAHAAEVLAGLGEGFVVSDLTGHRGTRTASGGKPAHTIDHVVAHAAEIEAAEVLDGEGLSDHEPVTARVVALS